jgi:hypothetical protein
MDDETALKYAQELLHGGKVDKKPNWFGPNTFLGATPGVMELKEKL